MKLKMNAKWVETLKPGPKRRDYHDTDCPGLTLRVTPSGAKSWTLMYYAGKRRRRLTIGSFPAIGLHDARKQGQKKRGAIQLGADPAAEKKAAREAGTFGELAAQYLDAKKHKRSIREDARIVDVYLNPRFEHAAAKDVKRSDIGAMLQTVAADAPVMANRVLACIRGIYNWAIGAGLLESTPCLRLQPPAPEKSRTRCLTNDEIRAVWKALDASTSTAIADLYKLRLLTAQRGGEIMGAAWSEFDLESRWWTIPGSRTKNKLDHRVYLSDAAMRILQRRKAANDKRLKRAGGPSRWVFPGKRKGKHLTEAKRAFEEIRGESGVENWTGHDLRRTAATAMTRDLKVTRFVVGRVLNHVSRSKRGDITAVYDVNDYAEEKQAALTAWGARVMRVVSGLAPVLKSKKSTAGAS